MDGMYTLRDHCSIEDLKRAIESGETDLLLTKESRQDIITAAQAVCFGVFDFDGTLNHRAQWMVLSDLMPDHIREEDESDVSWYLNLSQAQLKFDSAVHHPNWFHGAHDARNQGALEGAMTSRAIDRFKRSGMTKTHLQEAGKLIRLREGVRELFELMESRAVISYGIEQVIQACLSHHGLTAAIAGTRLRFDHQDRLCGYEPNVVVSTTKPIALDRFQQLTNAALDELLIMGDSIGDAEMMREGAFNVLMIPHGEQHASMQNYRYQHLEHMWKKARLVVISESILPLTFLIQQARALKQ